jgi:hypothetical protein
VSKIAGIMPNSSNDCQLADPKFQNKLPRDIENLNGEERKRSKRTRRWGSSEELLSKDQASHKDVSHGRQRELHYSCRNRRRLMRLSYGTRV